MIYLLRPSVRVQNNPVILYMSKKFLFITIVFVFIASCVDHETTSKIKPYSRLSYSWIDSKGEKNDLWIWSFEKISDDNYLSHKIIEAKLEHKYMFTSGEIEVKKSGVFVIGKYEGTLTGNYVFSEGKLEKGFIRTFR